MTNYWLCVTNAENWEKVKEKKIWGVSERNKGQIGRVKIGDVLVFYIKRKKIGGIFKAVSKSFKDKKKIFETKGFSEEERFAYRVKLKPIAIPKVPIDFSTLIPKLDFIIAKKMWGGYFRRAMQIIPLEDYEKIATLMNQA